MPYKSNKDIPKPVRDALPDHAQSIWRNVYNSMESRGQSEEVCARSAWSQVKNKYKKDGDKWVAKSEKDHSAPQNESSQNCLSKGAFKLLKVDQQSQIIYGIAITCLEKGEPHYDLQGHHIPEDVMLSAVNDFMSDVRINKTMHDGEQTGTVVHSFPLTEDLKKSLGIECDYSGWIVGCKPEDPEIIEKYLSGEFTGFSIGGSGQLDEVAEDD